MPRTDRAPLRTPRPGKPAKHRAQGPVQRLLPRRGMRFEFEHLGTTTPFELPEGQHLLGGGPEDHIRLDGLPPGLLALRIEARQLMVEAARTLPVSGVFAPPGVPRLVLPGEVLELPEGMCLRVLPEAPDERGVGTVAVLKGLLTGAPGLAPSRAATLTCLTGLDVGRTHALAEACTELGRGREATLRLRDRTVSRAHARILQGEDGFALEDRDSPNGVYLNGQRVKGRAPLSDGDVLELGRTFLRFQAPVKEPPPLEEAPPPAPVPETPQAGSPPSQDAAVPRPGGEWWLIGLGAVAALVGVVVTYALATGG